MTLTETKRVLVLLKNTRSEFARTTKLAVPAGRFMKVRPRSPLSKKNRLPNQAMSRSTATGISRDWISGLLRSP
ncbi:MAG: hypothetical protein IPM70_13455 [Proteobacteria bacterium]|nr:hypothetical protein [Pseudomonadota bacterium]